MIQHHIEGGIYYMAPLTILFVCNIGIFIYLLMLKLRNNDMPIVLLESMRQIGILILVLGIFGTLVGFLQMFDALETIKEDLSRQVISGGVKVALLTITYGSIYFCITQFGYILLSLQNRKKGI